MRKLLFVLAFSVVVALLALALRQLPSGAASVIVSPPEQSPADQTSVSPLPTVWLDPISSRVRPGEVFTVTVMITGASDLAAFEFDLLYEPWVVEVVTMTLGAFLSGTGRNTMHVGPLIDNASGLSIFAGFTWGHEPGVNGQGDLAHVRLRALVPGTSALTLQDVQLTDPRATVLPALSQDGAVTVAGLPTRLYLPLIVRDIR